MDDAVIAAQTDEELDTFLVELDQVLKLKILGKQKPFLGRNIYQITLQKQFYNFLRWKDHFS